MNADLRDAGEEIQVYLHSKFHDDNDDFCYRGNHQKFIALYLLNKHKTQMQNYTEMKGSGTVVKISLCLK